VAVKRTEGGREEGRKGEGRREKGEGRREKGEENTACAGEQRSVTQLRFTMKWFTNPDHASKEC